MMTEKKEIICYCTGTTKEQVEGLLEKGMKTLEEIAYQTGAATGCGGCDYMIEELIREHKNLSNLEDSTGLAKD